MKFQSSGLPMTTIVALACLAVGEAAVTEERTSMESRAAVVQTASWAIGPHVHPEERVPLAFHLRRSQAQLQSLEASFWDVSDPKSSRYGQHLNDEALRAFAPGTAGVVQQWLSEEGIGPGVIGPHADVVSIVLPAADAERLLATRLHHFTHTTLNRTISRAAVPYSLPAPVAAVVLVVSDLTSLPAPRLPLGDGEAGAEAEAGGVVHGAESAAAGADWPTDCGKCSDEHLIGGRYVTPQVLAARYRLGDAPTAGAKGSIAVAEFQGEYWDQDDLDDYSTTCNVTRINVTTVGANKPKQCSIPIIISLRNLCTETLLDLTTIKAVAGALPITDIFNNQYSILDWTTQVLALPEGARPLVHSVSYDNDEAQQPSQDYMDAVSAQLLKMGAAGLSVLAASGDQGTYGREGRKFNPGFPASSPYVTSVGGTDFLTRDVIGEEQAWSGSGGGFSNHFGQPPYQQAAVVAYLSANASGMPPATMYNASGRGFPDVSALGGQGNKYCVYYYGKAQGNYGTSAATPTVAGVAAKLNALRLAKGAPPMGFLNPFMYQNPKAFFDVTVGSNPGTGSGKGFPAIKGWDAATGLGTPNFEALAALV